MKLFTHKIESQTFDIYVGTNAKENWELINNSDPFDLWLHVDEQPSGHVIIKEKITNNTESNYPNQIISIAANYCKNQSKSKNNKKLKIVYTEVLNIKKGKEFGSVIVSKPKYLFI